MAEFLLPAAHFLGERMIPTIDRVYPDDAIIGCVQDLSGFLGLYNQAARGQDGCVFDHAVVAQFCQLWELREVSSGRVTL